MLVDSRFSHKQKSVGTHTAPTHLH